MVPAGNKAIHLSSVNHTAKIVHQFILIVKKLLECFTKKNYNRQIKQSLELKKKSREKVINYISNGEFIIIRLIVGFIKRYHFKK